MDNTELHYVTYDSEAIWDAMIISYVEAGGDVLYPGDEKEMLLRSVQSDIVQVLAGVDNALRMQTLRYAVGDYLDILGENRGCERIEAGPAKLRVLIEANKAVTFDKGTLVTADGDLFYEFDNIVSVGKSALVHVTCTTPGAVGNGLVAGTPMTLSKSNDAVDSIVCYENASGGMDREDDETYRERIREYGFASVTTGPAGQYEALAKSVSTSILDAKAINRGAGNVGIYLIIDDGVTKESADILIEKVKTALNDEHVRPLTDTVTVKKAGEITYSLEADVQSDGSSSTKAAIEDAVAEYTKWQNNKIGREFNPDKLKAMLYSAGATLVSWGSGSLIETPTEVVYSTGIRYVPVDSDYRCKGTVSVVYKE